MQIIETLENRKDALKVSELAKLLSVTPQHIYKTWAAGRIPGAFRVNRAIRFDPQVLAEWLKKELMGSDPQILPTRSARRMRAA
jgi:excisionase family DNA binding protein